MSKSVLRHELRVCYQLLLDAKRHKLRIADVVLALQVRRISRLVYIASSCIVWCFSVDHFPPSAMILCVIFLIKKSSTHLDDPPCFVIATINDWV